MIQTEELVASPPNQTVTQQKIPVSDWMWPTIILLSTLAVALVTFVMPAMALRPVIVMWFLFVCPGMALVRFLRLKESVVEWTLALALSFALDAIVAGIQIYARKWSPTGTLDILIGLSLGGALVQFATMRSSVSQRWIQFTTNLPRSTQAMTQEEEIAPLQERLSEALERLSTVVEQVSKTQVQVSHLFMQVNTLQAENQALKEQLVVASEHIAVVEQVSKTQHLEKLSSVEAENQALKEQLRKTQEQLNHLLLEKLSSVEAENQALKEQLVVAHKPIEELEQQKTLQTAFVNANVPKAQIGPKKERKKRDAHNQGTQREKPTQIEEHLIKHDPVVAGRQQAIEMARPPPLR